MRIKRFYMLRTDVPDEAADMALRWAAEGGGTIVANIKSTLEHAYRIGSDGEFKRFEEKCRRHKIHLATLRGKRYRASGKRLVLLYLSGNELAEIEQRLSSIGAPELEEILLVVWNVDDSAGWIKHYGARPFAASSDTMAHKASVTADALPEDIANVLTYLASMAARYGNALKWDEEAKLKADLMNNRQAWLGVSLEALREKCSQLGMALADTNTIAELVEKAQSGKRLVPDKSYKDFRFKH